MLCWGEYKKPQVCTTGVPTPKVGRQASLGAFLAAQVVKNLPVNAGDPGSIPGWRRSPGEGNGNPFQYSCLENPTDRGAWWVTVHGVTKSRPQLSDEHFHLCVCKEMAELNFERQIKTVHKEKPGMAHTEHAQRPILHPSTQPSIPQSSPMAARAGGQDAVNPGQTASLPSLCLQSHKEVGSGGWGQAQPG